MDEWKPSVLLLQLCTTRTKDLCDLWSMCQIIWVSSFDASKNIVEEDHPPLFVCNGSNALSRVIGFKLTHAAPTFRGDLMVTLFCDFNTDRLQLSSVLPLLCMYQMISSGTALKVGRCFATTRLTLRVSARRAHRSSRRIKIINGDDVPLRTTIASGGCGFSTVS